MPGLHGSLPSRPPPVRSPNPNAPRTRQHDASVRSSSQPRRTASCRAEQPRQERGTDDQPGAHASLAKAVFVPHCMPVRGSRPQLFDSTSEQLRGTHAVSQVDPGMCAIGFNSACQCLSIPVVLLYPMVRGQHQPTTSPNCSKKRVRIHVMWVTRLIPSTQARGRRQQTAAARHGSNGASAPHPRPPARLALRHGSTLLLALQPRAGLRKTPAMLIGCPHAASRKRAEHYLNSSSSTRPLACAR